MQSKLSPTGVMMDAETEEGLARRNSMAFRVKSGKGEMLYCDVIYCIVLIVLHYSIV